ncbi:hypothetical protein E2562_023075 [Oryza meyeriana var. granulata]|uniref:Uncharacterized protein n=1 Tax=Oryza meyeriana var. granulata TaxID=110450 RepID=A0A6G1EP09_9ORYZ|nr:hypothetical protein E2562_023075 [Oryza meyeriana var. granulata]
MKNKRASYCCNPTNQKSDGLAMPIPIRPSAVRNLIEKSNQPTASRSDTKLPLSRIKGLMRIASVYMNNVGVNAPRRRRLGFSGDREEERLSPPPSSQSKPQLHCCR